MTPAPPRITCREFLEALTDYLDGVMPPDQAAVFGRHMADCAECQRYLETYEEAIRLGRGAFADPDADVPTTVPKELLDAILATRKR